MVHNGYVLPVGADLITYMNFFLMERTQNTGATKVVYQHTHQSHILSIIYLKLMMHLRQSAVADQNRRPFHFKNIVFYAARHARKKIRGTLSDGFHLVSAELLTVEKGRSPSKMLFSKLVQREMMSGDIRLDFVYRLQSVICMQQTLSITEIVYRCSSPKKDVTRVTLKMTWMEPLLGSGTIC